MSDPSIRITALFLLGYGWNLCFVGGSGGLARGVPADLRPHVEGAVDAAVWGIAAAASQASTMILAAGGYGVLAGAAAVLTVVVMAGVAGPGGGRRAEPAA